MLQSKISSDQKRFFIPLSLYPISFFANTPFKELHDKKYLLTSWYIMYITKKFWFLYSWVHEINTKK